MLRSLQARAAGAAPLGLVERAGGRHRPRPLLLAARGPAHRLFTRELLCMLCCISLGRLHRPRLVVFQPEGQLVMFSPVSGFCACCATSSALTRPLLPALQYYDLPTLSLRSAAYHLMDAGLPKFQASRPVNRLMQLTAASDGWLRRDACCHAVCCTCSPMVPACSAGSAAAHLLFESKTAGRDAPHISFPTAA